MPVAVEETYSGNYIVVFDPIDGSANIDTSMTTGSIFGIYGPDKQCLVNLDDDSTVITYKLCFVPQVLLLQTFSCLYVGSSTKKARSA